MKRKELLDNHQINITTIKSIYNDGTIHVQISFYKGLECAFEGDSSYNKKRN